MNSALFVVFSVVGLLTIDCFADTLCHRNEIFEFGKTGQVRCSFQEEYFGVYWYDTQDLTQQPVIYREDGEVGGHGYESNLFDITKDESLIIINVTIEHERVFTAVILETSDSLNLKHEKIDVKVFARPSIPYPVILKCDGMRFCYKAFDISDPLKCFVQGARPPVYLKWLSLTAEGYVDVTFQREYSDQEGLNTTTVTMKLQVETASLRLFACKADTSTMVLNTLGSVIIAEILQLPSNVEQVDNLTSMVGGTVKLACNGFPDVLFFVWKLISSDNHDDVIAYGYITGGLMSSKEPYSVESDGLLVIADFSHTLEGVYVCFASDGIHERTSSYHVTSFAASLTSRSTVETHEEPEKRKNLIAAVAVIPIVIVLGAVTVTVLLLVRHYRKTAKNETAELPEEEPLKQFDMTTTYPDKYQQKNEVTVERDDDIGDDNDDDVVGNNDKAMNLPSLQETSITKDGSDHRMDELKSQEDTSRKEDNTLKRGTSKQRSICLLTYNRSTSPLKGIEIRHYTAGSSSSIDRDKKVILVCGARLPTKTRLIKKLISFFVSGMQDSDIHYEVQRDPRDECFSKDSNVVNEVTIYTNPLKRTFDLTIMDLHDSVKESEKVALYHSYISDHILKLWEYDFQHVSAVIFVKRCSLDEPGCYSFTRLFGKNLRENMYIYETNKDTYLLDTCYQKSDFLVHLTASKEVSVSAETKYNMWNEQKCSLEQFSKDVESCHISLNESIEVLRERTNIKSKLVNLMKDLHKHQQKQKYLQSLRKNQSNVEVDLDKGVMAMNCRNCKTTCHLNCTVKSNTADCKEMRYFPWLRGCGACRRHCYPNEHALDSFRYKNGADRSKEKKEICRLEKALKDSKNVVSKDVEVITESLNVLSDIAIKPTELSVKTYKGNIVVKEIIGNTGNFNNCQSLLDSL